MVQSSFGSRVSDPVGTAERSSDGNQFVVFMVENEVFGVEMTPVQEIIRVPEVVRVPLAPPCLEGLANLRGEVLPIISLRRIFGFPEKGHDEATRAIVINLGQPMAFVVDRVSSVVRAEAEQIQGVDGNIRATVDSELLTGILREVGGLPIVMVVNFGSLIARMFGEADMAFEEAVLSKGEGAGSYEEKEGYGDEVQLVSFSVEGQEYAVEINFVQEIVQVPKLFVHVPNSPPHVLGLMTLRERLLPLISLRTLFGLDQRETDDRSRVVVLSLEGRTLGLVTDSVSEVLRVPKELVEDIPALVAHSGNMGEIKQLCRLEGGKRLVSILSPERLFQLSHVKEESKVAMELEDRAKEKTAFGGSTDEEEQVVVFQLAGGEFGVPIESVQEIVRLPEGLTKVPKAPGFVEGIINLRGVVLPVIDLRKRLDLEECERNERQRIMVFALKGTTVGFIVDAVTEVLKIPKRKIEASPRLSVEQAKLMGRVANLEEQRRMIQMIEPQQLLEEGEYTQLAQMG